MNVNAPNIGQAKFLPRLNFFLDFSADPIVIGGDFNLVSDPAVDRSSPTLPTDRSLSVAFKELNKSLAMSDIWRVLNPCVYKLYSVRPTILNYTSPPEPLLLPSYQLSPTVSRTSKPGWTTTSSNSTAIRLKVIIFSPKTIIPTSQNSQDIFDLNGPLLLKTIKEDIKRWTVLPISIWGRAEVLKMNILPRLLFLISAIPLKFPLYWFTEINKLFTDFLWSNKKTRISYKRLTRPRKRGGLGVPDVYSYYLAYNARFPMLWAYTGQSEFGSWKWVDENILANQDKSLSLTALWYYPKTNLKIGNPLITFSCEVVKIIQKRLPFNGAYLPSCF